MFNDGNETDISDDYEQSNLESAEDKIDSKAFLETKQRYEQNPVSYSHEEVGRKLNFL